MLIIGNNQEESFRRKLKGEIEQISVGKFK